MYICINISDDSRNKTFQTSQSSKIVALVSCGIRLLNPSFPPGS